ncbi:uncharacterized protein BDR25DRAFT_174336, partial [Lindgomyces ingoldianus]
SLMDLPEELLSQVIINFNGIRAFETQAQAFKCKPCERSRQCENHQRQKTLHALSLTSRALKRISEPVLYSSFPGITTWNGLQRLRQFSAAIASRPHFAGYLQYVENRFSDYIGNSLYDDLEFYGAEEMVKEYFFKLGRLIESSPNIKHISVVSMEASDISLWKPLLWKNNGAPQITAHGLLKLETLCLQLNTNDYGMGEESSRFRHITNALASLPSLKQFSASGVVTPDDVTPLVGKCESLNTINVSECILDLEEIISLVSVCDNLKHLTVHWAYLNSQRFQLSDLYAALRKHKDSLEHLQLDTRNVRFRDSDFPLMPLGNLRDFKTLRSLVLCETSLLAPSRPLLEFPDVFFPMRMSEVLPPSLESLAIL